MPQLTPEQDRALATTPTEELLSLDLLQPENIQDTVHAYQLAKRCNEKRGMYECIRWGQRSARELLLRSAAAGGVGREKSRVTTEVIMASVFFDYGSDSRLPVFIRHVLPL